MELSGKNDLVIGAVTNYTKKELQYWVNSLNRCGYVGGKILLCYNIKRDDLLWLQNEGVHTSVFQQDAEDNAIYPVENFSIVSDRFYHYWQLLRFVLSNSQFRYLIATDVKDVIFQTNPSDFLETYLEKHERILLSSEGLNYQDEPWGANNIQTAFGRAIYERYKDKEIVNCGVLAGRYESMVDLFLNIALICYGLPGQIPGGGGPDQAAMNIITKLDPYKDHCKVTSLFSAQLGTTGDPSKLESFRPYLLQHHIPEWTGETFRHPFSGEDYPIVHQWDRMSEEIVSKIKEKYS